MNDPSRWLDDAETPPELRELLSSAERPQVLDDVTRSRLGVRVARLAVPVSLVTWLSVKSAAAIGVVAGLVTAGTSIGVSTYMDLRAQREETTVARPGPERRSHAVPRPAPEPAMLNPAPSLREPKPQQLPPTASFPTPVRSGGLAEESLLLERARSSLAGSPAQALELARDHQARFPRAQLASERSLVELEALHRLGRHAEARALAQRLLAAGGDDLYRARVEGLLQKMER